MESPVTVEIWAGEHISQAAQRLVDQANQLQHPVQAIFNDIPLQANPGQSPDSIVQRFNIDNQQLTKQYRQSPQHKQQQDQQRRQLEGLQAQADQLLAQLDTLDFSQPSQLLTWMEQYQQPSEHSGVKKDSQYILQVFAQHGYVPNMNVDHDFDGQDAANYAEYIIGQALAGIQLNGAILGVIHEFLDQWRAEFS